MLIELKVKTELPIIILRFHSLEWFEQVSDFILSEQRTAQDAHNFNDWTTDLHVMFDDANEAVCDDSNMNLDADGILGFTPKGFDAEMLLDPLEEQLNLPPIFIQECDIFGSKIKIVSVVCESAIELWRVVNDATNRRWIIRFISLSSEANRLVTKNIILSFFKVKPTLNFIGRMKLFSNDKECPRTIDFIESHEVKVASIKHIAGKRLVCKPVHRVDVVHLSIGDSVEHRNLRDNVNLCMDSYARLGCSELRPSENRETEVDRCGINRIESSMQLKLTSETLRLGNRHHVESKLFKDSVISDRVRLGKNLSVDNTLPKAEEKRFVSMGNCYICKFPETSASKQLTEHENQHVVPMSKRPSPCAIVVLDCQTFEVPFRKELGYLCENIVTRMHICSNFDLDAKVRISKVRQDFRFLCNCV